MPVEAERSNAFGGCKRSLAKIDLTACDNGHRTRKGVPRLRELVVPPDPLARGREDVRGLALDVPFIPMPPPDGLERAESTVVVDEDVTT